jgi:hypothetical protein
MKIEFHPDFRIPPEFKAIVPRFKEAFRNLKFKPENYRQMMRKMLLILFCACLLILVIVAAMKIL